MIEVRITGPSRNGRFPYRIGGFFQAEGLSHEPLLDACRRVKSMGGDTAAVAGLFHEGANVWALRTNVGIGANLTVFERDRGNIKFGRYREFQGQRG